MIDEITTKRFKIGLCIPKLWKKSILLDQFIKRKNLISEDDEVVIEKKFRDIFHCTFIPFSESNEVTFKSRMRVPLQIVMVYQNTILGFIKLAFVYEWMAFSKERELSA